MTISAAALPLTAATDASALARLHALPAAETARLLDTLAALPSPTARQDHLITQHRVVLSLPALETWLTELRAARDAARFDAFLADIRRAAERAEAFRELLAKAERIHQVNIALLAAHLFDALVARDAAAIESLAHAFAEIVAAHLPASELLTSAF